MAETQLNLYATYKYTDRYFDLPDNERKDVRTKIASTVAGLAEANHLYSIFPARCDGDFLVWSAQVAEDPEVAGEFLAQYQTKIEDLRCYITPAEVLWGFTRPSMYARGKTEQDIDPFDGDRRKYFVIYPFSKTKEWYLMTKDSRQGMMNEHIKKGKEYPEIKQLLLYSFGLQDQEFVVSYEMDDLAMFSKLVHELRSTQGRIYTALDTPIITGVHRTPEEFVGQ